MGVPSYTIRHLAEALRKRGTYVAGATVVLIGFDDHEDTIAKENARDIISSLERNGARIRRVYPQKLSFEMYRDALEENLAGADAVLLDTDSRHFRALRPREIRSFGVEVIIPTSLRA